MTEFVPRGYISIREALNRLGRELFHSEWTGEEHKARSGLINPDEWVKIGMSGSGTRRGRVRLRPGCLRPAIEEGETLSQPILVTLRTRLSTGRLSDMRPHVMSFVFGLRPVISKRPSWIPGVGNYIGSRLECGASTMPIGSLNTVEHKSRPAAISARSWSNDSPARACLPSRCRRQKSEKRSKL
jgi:hypothetical protein